MTVSAKQLRERLAAKVQASRDILDLAKAQGRQTTAEELARVETLHGEAQIISAQIPAVASAERRDLQLPPPIGDSSQEAYVDGQGRRIPVLRSDQSFASADAAGGWATDVPVVGQSPDAVNVGELVAGLITGDMSPPRQAALKNFQSGGSDTGGGYLLSPSMSARIIDLARNKSVVMRAGAKTVPMDASELTIARVATDPTAYWRHEGMHLAASDMAFGSVTLVARVLGCLVPVTLELLEDASNAGQVIQAAIAQALALELDRAALRGAGSEATDPVTGVRFAENVGTTAIDGVPTYDNLLDGLTPIEVANGTPNAWIVNPTINGVIRKLKDGDNNYLAEHPDVARLKKLISNQVPGTLGGDGDESEIYFGDFTSVLLGMRKRVTVEIFAAGRDSDDTFNAMTQLGRWIRVHLRADVAIEQPTWFNVLTGVSAS